VAIGASGGAATPAVALAVLGAAERVNALVKTLNPTELAVYEAVLQVSKAREKAKTQPYGASAAEVEKYFLDQKQEPPAAAFLTQLANKKVLTSDVDGSVVRYSVVK